MLVTKARMIFFLMLITSFIYLIHKFYFEEWSYYYRYQTIPLNDGSVPRNNFKIILLWTSYQGNWRGWTGGLGHDQIISNCKSSVMNGECILTSNKNYVTSADVVLFSLQDLKQEYISLQSRSSVFPDVPWNIRQKQLWIAMWYEPNLILEKYHYYTKEYLQSLNNKFNATITYRNDSLIKNLAYDGGCQYKRNDPDSLDENVIIKSQWKDYMSRAVNKSRLVSWIVSHCNTPSGRDEYVSRMKTVIDVDVYGRCGSLELVRGHESKTMSEYMFYLAFENSKCPDYVTEKLFRVINTDISESPPVAVVMGPNKTWYEEHLPSRSFIHVNDFESPEKLADYLKFLSQNSNEYMEYHSWRRQYKKTCAPSMKCQLCKNIVNHKFMPHNTQSIKDFERFWKMSACEKPVENSDTEQNGIKDHDAHETDRKSTDLMSQQNLQRLAKTNVNYNWRSYSTAPYVRYEIPKRHFIKDIQQKINSNPITEDETILFAIDVNL